MGLYLSIVVLFIVEFHARVLFMMALSLLYSSLYVWFHVYSVFTDVLGMSVVIGEYLQR